MKVIIGDNPFFGVNHQHGSKPLDNEAIRFQKAVDVLAEAKMHNSNHLMITNHPSILKFLDFIDENNLNSIRLAFVAPYPHKYNDIVANKGYLGLIRYLLKGNSLYILKNLLSFLNIRNAHNHLVKMICNSELSSLGFQKSKVEYMCMHNILVDMYVASGNISALKTFVKYTISKNLKPVLITQNIIPLCKALEDFHEDYTICFSYNTAGYMVNPSLDEVDIFLKNNEKKLPNLWAMQIMGSGILDLDHALQATKRNKFNGILYATTKRKRITELFNKIQ